MSGLPHEEATQAEIASELGNARKRFVWLAAVHVLVGVLAMCLSNSDYFSTWRMAFSMGIVLSQIGLIGIWGGLGGGVWLRRGIDVLLGVVYLMCLSGFHLAGPELSVLMVLPVTGVMVFVAYMVRLRSGPIYHVRHSERAAHRGQFSLFELFVFTTTLAGVIAIGRFATILGDFAHSELFRGSLIYLVVCAFAGILIVIFPMGCVMATNHPVVCGIGVVVVEVAGTHAFGQIVDPRSQGTLPMISIATVTVSVVITMGLVRSWGYRLTRLPPAHRV